MCDGADNDGDGEIDEGFPDDDGKGRVDCLDQVCPVLDLGSPGPTVILEACEGTTGGGGSVVTDP